MLQSDYKKARVDLGETATVSTRFSTEDRGSRIEEKQLGKGRKRVKTEVLRRFTSELPGPREASRSNGTRTAEEPDREHENGTEKTENSVNGDSHEAERQQEQPHERI